MDKKNSIIHSHIHDQSGLLTKSQRSVALGYAIILCGLTAATIMVFTYRAGVQLNSTYQRELAFNQSRQEIIWLDEVLTMSAKMAAATGDPQWHERYSKYEPILDLAFANLIVHFPEVQSARKTLKSNQELVAMEIAAFALIKKERYTEASEILNSSAYNEQKVIYHQGIDEAKAKIDYLLSARNVHLQSSVKVLSVFAIIFMLLTVAGWIFVLRNLIRSNRRLERFSHRYKQQAKENRFILDTFQIGVWKLNPKDQSLVWDKSMYSLYGLSEEDFSGHYQAWESSLTEEAKAKAVAELEQAIKGEKEFNTVFEIQSKSGGRRFIAARAIVIRDELGHPLMVYGVNQDVTEEMQKEKHVSFIVNSLGIGIWKWDLVTNQLDWDENMYRLYGIRKGEMTSIEEIWQRMTPEEDKQKIHAEIEAALKGAKEFDMTFKAVRRDGKTQEIRSLAFIVRNQEGKPIELHGINVDRNREVKLEKLAQQERSKALLNAKLASLGELSAGIAHEINNPLAIIDGTVRSLKKFTSDQEKFDKKIETLIKSSERITKIVNSLKKFSMTSGEAKLTPRPLSGIVHESVTLTKAKSNLENTPVHLNIQTDAQVLCDEIEIEQVLVNLINNAIDAVKGLADKWVRIDLTEVGSTVILRVRDSGSGISPKVRAKLFEPFFTTKSTGLGTGLGLSIVKGILDSHHASIDVLTADANTCFEIRFQKVVRQRKLSELP